MATLTKPTNPHNNITPEMLTQDNFQNPVAIATEMANQSGLPKEVLDKVFLDVEELVTDSWLGFLDMFNMNIAVSTDYLNFIETETPDYVIDDDGAVTRAGDVFTIDWTAVEGYEVGDDPFFFRVNDEVMIVDGANPNVKNMGVITAVNKTANTFTAIVKDGAAWTVGTTNLTVDVTGSDHDKASCGPEGLMELRKRKSNVIKLQIIKEAMKSAGGERWAFYNDKGDINWYDQNSLFLQKRFNTKIAKTLLLGEESASNSPAYAAGKYGTLGLFKKLRTDGLSVSGYITTMADLEAWTEYMDSLGYKNKEFVAHCDRTQYRNFETLAGLIATDLGVTQNITLNNNPTNWAQFGFNTLTKDGYTIRFSKWDLVDGNSPLGKNRIKNVMPKAIIMPMGTVKTEINGETKNVPYIFKVYQNNKMKPGMIRTYLTGGFNGDGDCEYSKISQSTTVGIGVVVPEAITIVD